MQYPSPSKIRQIGKDHRSILRNKCSILAKDLARQLVNDDLSISFAESVTGGMLMSYLVNQPGISEVLKGGIVSYQKATKISLLNISTEVLDKHTCESLRTSTAMAESIKEMTQSDIGVGITGIASPVKKGKGKPTGSLFIAIVFRGYIYQTEVLAKGSRIDIRLKAVHLCLEQILGIISNPSFISEAQILEKGMTTKGRRIRKYKIDECHF